MNQVLYVIKGTPVWVWAVLLYLLFIGSRAISTKIVYLPKLFVIPLILLAMNDKVFLSRHSVTFISIITFSTILIFAAHHNTKVGIIRNSKSIKLPGSPSDLLVLICFFVVKYYFGYLNATAPEFAIKYSLFEIAISGLFSGYFLGRSIRYMHKYVRDSCNEND